MSKKPAAYLAGSVLIGTAIGAVIGLLTSPVGGRRARNAVRGKLQGTRELLREPLKHLPGLAQQTDDLRHRLQDEANERIEPLKRRLQGIFRSSDAAPTVGDEAPTQTNPERGTNTKPEAPGNP